MARFENEGFCPNNTVARRIAEAENSDTRLVGLWSLIGSRVVCTNVKDGPQVNSNAVDEMFSTDPIAFHLMKALLEYDIHADRISVRQFFSGACNTQAYDDIQETICALTKEDKHPKLVIYSQSRFACIIAKSELAATIDLIVWDMSACW